MLSTGISILGINTPFLLHMSYWSSGLKWANNNRGHDKFIWACEKMVHVCYVYNWLDNNR